MALMPQRLVPLLPPERARDVARGWEALARTYADAEMTIEADEAMTRSQWWLSYALVLERTAKPDTPDGGAR